MKIAHVDAETGFSGGERQVFLLMEGLRAHGHHNLLICPPGSRAAEEARRVGFEVVCVSMRNDLDVSAILALTREFRRAAADLIHLHTGRATWLGAWAAHWAGIPALSTRRMDRRVRPGLLTRTLYTRLLGRVAAISPAVVDALRTGGIPEQHLSLIPSSIDPENFLGREMRESTRAELALDANHVLLLTLAQLIPRKGLDILLRAVHKLPPTCPVQLAIAGDGIERPRLEHLTVELGLGSRVRFLGRCEHSARLLHAADIFVLPSRAEGLGVAALEAMAAGLPVVASRVGGLADLVLDGITGALVPKEDVPALAQAILRLSQDASLRLRQGTAGRERLKDGFLASQMVAAYERLYRELLREAGRT